MRNPIQTGAAVAGLISAAAASGLIGYHRSMEERAGRYDYQLDFLQPGASVEVDLSICDWRPCEVVTIEGKGENGDVITVVIRRARGGPDTVSITRLLVLSD